MLGRSRAAGDTIIEVLLAVTIFSMLAGITLTLMNQSVNAAQRAVEITLVRQEIDAQADMLRALHEAVGKSSSTELDDTLWASAIKPKATAVRDKTYVGDQCPDNDINNRELEEDSFALAINGSSIRSLDTSKEGSDYKPAGTDAETPPYAQVKDGRSYGIWIEPTTEGMENDDKVGAYVFRIRACWDSPGADAPMRLETIVKLYDVLDGRG